ncbi:MAG: alpha/beta hydrolase [Acidobacteria bacterium]|nr:alpha/beta hydrolase [Acidobacteriota bacterium]
MFHHIQKAINFIRNSTNVRQITNLLKHTLIRTKFQILSKLSLTWAAKEGIQLFFRTYKHKRPEREEKLLLNATKKITFNWQGKKLAAWEWGNASAPAILLVHGWNGRGAQLGSFISPLINAGYRVITYDAPGHGNSPGTSASLVDLSEAITAILSQVNLVEGIIAHSLGAAASTLSLIEGSRVSWAVYIAPPLQPRDYIHKFARFLRASPELTDLMIGLMSSYFRRSWENLDIPTLAKSLETPLLVIHDEEDKDVPFFEGAELAKAWPKAKLIPTKGLGHRRILHNKEVIEETLAFIKTHQLNLNQVNHNLKEKTSLVTRISRKCSQEGCENLVLGTWDITGQRCSSCLMDAELFNPSLRWA